MRDRHDAPPSRGWFARLLGRLRGDGPDGMRRPYIRRHEGFVSLQFIRSQTQSRMVDGDPGRLLIDYTRTMFAALLWQPAPRVLGMVGLGGGSQVKFAHAQLPATRIEVVEHNPHVVALRREFGIPDDDDRLDVVVDDGARFVAARRDAFDLLLLDGYDERGIPAVLSTQTFYDDCRDALTAHGVLACNLYVRDPETHIAKLRQAFGDAQVLVIDEPKMSNRVAFAWRGELPGLDADALVARVPTAIDGLLPGVMHRIATRIVRHRTLASRG